jgi:hypothetical protein
MNAERPPASTIIDGLPTISDKIRALAKAGYLRTEIGKILEIRYQHVRKVLLNAGIAEGLTRNAGEKRPSSAVARVIKPRESFADHVLLNAGFRHLGQWQTLGGGEFKLAVSAPAEPGVYAFVVDGLIRYVGLTQTGLRTRMGHYRRGHKGHKTSSRVKDLIASALGAGKTVNVLIATPEPLEWNGLPINTAAGLEAGLIRMLRPDWNMLGAGR